jgi:hypothetical protein
VAKGIRACFSHDVRAMDLNGQFAGSHFICDLLVQKSGSGKVQDFFFAGVSESNRVRISLTSARSFRSTRSLTIAF